MKSGLSYHSTYGCGVDDSCEQVWKEHLALHKSIKPYRNKGWTWYEEMDSILNTVKVKGTHRFAAASQPSQTPLPGSPQGHNKDVDEETQESTQDTQQTTQVDTEVSFRIFFAFSVVKWFLGEHKRTGCFSCCLQR